MAPRSAGSSTADGDSPLIDAAAEVDALYLDDPDGFTAAREALAKRLRAAGRKDEAAAVNGGRGPTGARRRRVRGRAAAARRRPSPRAGRPPSQRCAAPRSPPGLSPGSPATAPTTSAVCATSAPTCVA